MKTSTSQKGSVPVIILLSLGLLAILVLYYKFSPLIIGPTPKYNPSPSTTESSTSATLKHYSSKNLKFSVDIPTYLNPNEQFTSITLTSNEGEININRLGTNFINVKDYVKDLVTKNNLKILAEQEVKLGENEFLRIDIIDPNNKNKILVNYYFYVNDSIYRLSSSDKSLYPTLDQIAQSFRYTP